MDFYGNFPETKEHYSKGNFHFQTAFQSKKNWMEEFPSKSSLLVFTLC